MLPRSLRTEWRALRKKTRRKKKQKTFQRSERKKPKKKRRRGRARGKKKKENKISKRKRQSGGSNNRVAWISEETRSISLDYTLRRESGPMTRPFHVGGFAISAGRVANIFLFALHANPLSICLGRSRALHFASLIRIPLARYVHVLEQNKTANLT